MMEELDKLRECPFCGGKADLYILDADNTSLVILGARKSARIKCCNCFCDISLTNHNYEDIVEIDQIISDAIEAWNTRAERTCEWIPSDHCTWRCSCCGIETEVLYRYWKHCPNCGAKVVES